MAELDSEVPLLRGDAIDSNHSNLPARKRRLKR
jgi:hypothetical protein